MASLRVNVQADRLPDVGGKLQIALRVTAAVEKIDAADLPAGAVDEVMPWKWQAPDGKPWTPHTHTAWRVWRIAGRTSKEITTGVSAVIVLPTKFEGDNVP